MDQEILELNGELNSLKKQCKLQESSMNIASSTFHNAIGFDEQDILPEK